MSLVKQNFAAACEEAINQQINTELQASQVYLSMAAWAGHSDVALPGFQKMWQASAAEERQHAQMLIDYQNKRGGRVKLAALYAPESQWTSAKNTLEAALQIEKDVNKSLLNLNKIAEDNNDPHLSDFITSTFLTEQVDAIKALADKITQMNRFGSDGLGLHLFDQELLKA